MADQLPYTLQQVEIEKDDINQEAALYELLHPGKKANRSYIRKRLMIGEPSAIFSGDITSIALPLNTGNTVNLFALDKLIEWATNQSAMIECHILEFLEDPTEEGLKETLDLLVVEGLLVIDGVAPKSQKASFMGALISLFERNPGRPLIMGELLVWARQIHQSKRPEAALRQALRRLVHNNLVIITPEGHYSYNAGGQQ